MSHERLYSSADFFKPSKDDPIRSVVTESPDAVVVAWQVEPGQTIAPHVHPSGQDTWIVIAGHGEYIIDEQGTTRNIKPGDIVIAHTGAVHGVHNRGAEVLRFISVVAPAEAGYQLV